jgi:ABC-type transporter Mla subunit MlaD
VDAGSQVLDVTSRRSPELSAVLRELPGTATAADRAVANVRALSGPLDTALTNTRPAFRALPAALRKLDSLTPTAGAMLTNLQDLERSAATQLPSMRRFTARLGDAATQGVPNIQAASRTVDVLSGYGKGLAQLGDLISGAVSTSDVNGVMARSMFTAVEPPRPSDLGLPSSTSSARMDSLLAVALQRLCARNAIACLLRVATPGLPPVVRRAP